ncbi:Bor family protein [Pantoea ananatis]|uniref:Bor family protein n=1 Tax=Pantoea ananas TaxID=553 RepID=UPI0024ADF6CA|nr:Bor family protein [Pantoea ananatis]MDI6539557.1 Bor family protein [Pantoea ananatis]
MKSILVLFLAVTLAGCAKQSFDLKQEPAGTPAKEETHHFFISGLGQKKNIDAAAVCGGADKVSRTETQLTFMNGFLNVITFGIYTPREASVYCSK